MLINKQSLIRYNLLVIGLFVLVGFFTIDAYAAELQITLNDESDESAFEAIISGSAVGGQQIVQFDSSTISITVNPGTYNINLRTNNAVFNAFIENPDECDGRIPTDDTFETCDVGLGQSAADQQGLLGFAFDSGTTTSLTFAETEEADEENDPPFKVCLERVREILAPDVDADNERTTVVGHEIQKPSSAQYFIKGDISGEKLQEMIDRNGKTDLTFKIINDLHSADILPISHDINTKYIGQIVAYKKEGVKKDVLDFMIDTIDTKCRYITLIQPSKELNAKQSHQWTPLTEEGKFKFEKSSIPQASKFEDTGLASRTTSNLMVGDAWVRWPTADTAIHETLLNPPFGSCTPHVGNVDPQLDATDTTDATIRVTEKVDQDADFAEYVLVGNIQDSLDSHNKQSSNIDILIKITVDLNLRTAADSAKITDNQNPYVKVEFILSPDQQGAELLDFKLKELSWNCHGVGFALWN